MLFKKCLFVAAAVLAAFCFFTISSQAAPADDPFEGWTETTFYVSTDLPHTFTQSDGQVAICWGGALGLDQVWVFGPEDYGQTLDGDACRVWIYTIGVISQIGIANLAQGQYDLLSNLYPDVTWVLVFVNGNLWVPYTTFIPIVLR